MRKRIKQKKKTNKINKTLKHEFCQNCRDVNEQYSQSRGVACRFSRTSSHRAAAPRAERISLRVSFHARLARRVFPKRNNVITGRYKERLNKAMDGTIRVLHLHSIVVCVVLSDCEIAR